MSAAAGSRIICFSHIPWFIHKHDEAENKIFNINLEVRLKILDKLYNAGKPVFILIFIVLDLWKHFLCINFLIILGVRHFFCGHYHRNGGGFYKDMELVITSAIGLQLDKDKSGFRIVKVKKETVSHQYYALDEVPQTINFD